MSTVAASDDDSTPGIDGKGDQWKTCDKKRKLANDHLEDFNEESIPGDDESNEAADENDDDDSDVEDDEDQETEIQVDFKAFPPEEIDFQGICKLIKQSFLKENIDISGIADFIIKNNNEFSLVMKQESEEENKEEEQDNDEEVYAVTSLIPLNVDLKVSSAIAGLRNYFLAKTENSTELNQALKASSNLYWMVNERFINLSPKLSLPSFELILKEMVEAKKSVDNIVMMIKILKEEIKESKASKQKKSKLGPDVIYQNPEEELLDESCDSSVEFSVASQCDEDARSGYWDDDDTKYVPYRKILLFSKTSFDKAIEALRKELQKC